MFNAFESVLGVTLILIAQASVAITFESILPRIPLLALPAALGPRARLNRNEIPSNILTYSATRHYYVIEFIICGGVDASGDVTLVFNALVFKGRSIPQASYWMKKNRYSCLRLNISH